MTKSSPVLNAAIFEILDNQLRDRNPIETKETFDRLIAEGFSKQEARRLIAVVISNEIFNILKREEPFNHERFVKALHRLPETS